MSPKISKELSNRRIEQAREELEASKMLYKVKFYKSANNRAYYSIFHSIKAVLALEPIDFKRHKDVTAYFNKNYVNTEIFPKKLGHKIAEAVTVREDSDYDDEFIVKPEETEKQIKTAEELLNLVEQYLNGRKNSI